MFGKVASLKTLLWKTHFISLEAPVKHYQDHSVHLEFLIFFVCSVCESFVLLPFYASGPSPVKTNHLVSMKNYNLIYSGSRSPPEVARRRR